MIELRIPTAAQSAELPLRAAFEAALAGGQVIERYFRQEVEYGSKAGEQPFNLVTQADLESERAIARALRNHFPDHELVGEEESVGNLDAEQVWIIDPLDGTNNFAHRIPCFAVSIAYYLRGQAECGVVVNPVRGDWYWAQRGQGAYFNGNPIRVSRARSLGDVIIGVGFYYDRGAMMEATLQAMGDFFRQQVHGIRRFGAAALDLCQVAAGQFGAFFEYQLSPWDFAAGRLILEEAGGRVTTCQGVNLPLATTSLLASNGHLHEQALRIVSARQPSPSPHPSTEEV